MTVFDQTSTNKDLYDNIDDSIEISKARNITLNNTPLPCLRTLKIVNCPNINFEKIGKMGELQELTIDGCDHLRDDDLTHFSHVENIILKNAQYIRSGFKRLFKCKKLTLINCNCINPSSFKGWVQYMPYLESLIIHDCSNFTKVANIPHSENIDVQIYKDGVQVNAKTSWFSWLW